MAMKRVKFTALPDESGPVSPDRLDELQDNVEEYVDSKASRQVGSSMAQQKWYRVAKITNGPTGGTSAGILVIASRYGSGSPMTAMFSLIKSYSKMQLKLIDSLIYSTNKHFTKIRAQYDSTSQNFYIDVYYDKTVSNVVYTNFICGTQDIELLTEEETTEYTTVSEITIS